MRTRKHKYNLKYYSSVWTAVRDAVKYGLICWMIVGAGLGLLFLIMFTFINHTAAWYESIMWSFGIGFIACVAAFFLKLQSTYARQYFIERRLKAILPPASEVIKDKIYRSKKDRKTEGYQWDVRHGGIVYKFTLIGQWLSIGVGKRHFEANIPFVRVDNSAKTKITALMEKIGNLDI